MNAVGFRSWNRISSPASRRMILPRPLRRSGAIEIGSSADCAVSAVPTSFDSRDGRASFPAAADFSGEVWRASGGKPDCRWKMASPWPLPSGSLSMRGVSGAAGPNRFSTATGSPDDWLWTSVRSPGNPFAVGSATRVGSRSSWALPQTLRKRSLSGLSSRSKSFRVVIAVIAGRGWPGRTAAARSRKFGSIFSTVVGSVPGSCRFDHIALVSERSLAGSSFWSSSEFSWRVVRIPIA